MSVAVTVAPLATPIIPISPLAPILLVAGIGLLVASQLNEDFRCQPKVASSTNSDIPEEHKQFVYEALKRLEKLHEYPISRWDEDFLNIGLENGYLTLEILDIAKTTLQTKNDIDIFLNLLKIDAQKLVQERLYINIIDKADSKGLYLQDEIIEDDETIVLTYRIP